MELCIQSPFTAKLHKLYLYHAGSFYKAHREQEPGVFAKLLIQLPSEYKGGQLIVNYEGKTKIIALSSNETDNLAYRTFYSVFYSDCEHELLPVIEGFRFSLVYNLIVDETDTVPVPTPNAAVQMELKALFNNWTTHGKIVYALKHNYSETNLTSANLKASDEVVANVLRCLSTVCNVNCYLTIFENHVVGHCGRAYKESGNFNTDDEISVESKEYELHSLTPISDSAPLSGLSLKNIDFISEVIPEDCFSQIKSYLKSWSPTENEKVSFSKSTRIAAIVFWPGSKTIDILKYNGVSHAGLVKYFLEEVERHWENVHNENIQQKLVKIATSTVISNDDRIHDMSIFTRAVTHLMNDLNLLGKFLEQSVLLNESIIHLVMENCKNFGWKALSTQWVVMFQKVINTSLKSGVSLLNLLISEEIDQGQTEVCCKILETMLNGFEDGSNATTNSTKNTDLKKCSLLTQLREDPSISDSLYCAAQKLKYDIMEFMKNKSLMVAAEVLVNLYNVTNHLDRRWIEIASHFIAEFEKKISREAKLLARCRTTTRICYCKDCLVLNSFLTANTESINFKVPKTRRKHLEVKIKSIKDIKYVETENGLTVTKTFMVEQHINHADSMAVVLIEKLRKIL